jgi:hypothetical protein
LFEVGAAVFGMEADVGAGVEDAGAGGSASAPELAAEDELEAIGGLGRR